MKFHGTTTGRMQGKSVWTPQAIAAMQQQLNPSLFDSAAQYKPALTRKGLLQLTTQVQERHDIWNDPIMGSIAPLTGDKFALQVRVYSSVVPGPGKTLSPGQAARMIEVLEEEMLVPATTSRADQKQFLETMCEVVAVRLERPYRLVNPIATREPQKAPKITGRVGDEVIMYDIGKGTTDLAEIEKQLLAYYAADVDLTKQSFIGATTWHSKT